MSQPIRWLREESKQWVAQGLITSDQAQSILRLYPDAPKSLPWGTLIFAGIGACMLGLGIILLFAYNWQAIPKFVKLGVVLGGVAVFHGVGIMLLKRTDWLKQVGDVSCLLGSMLFGAGIWLIAQIYHIDEHFPNGFLIWGIGALAMAWVIPSTMQALLGVILFGIWSCTETWGFENSVHWAPFFIFGCVGAIAWRQKSGLLLWVMLAIFDLSLCANVGNGLVLRVMLFTAALFLAMGIPLRRHDVFPASGGIFSFYGWGGFLFCVYLLTFPDIANQLLTGRNNGWSDEQQFKSVVWSTLYTWGPFVAALAGWIAVAWYHRPWASKEKRIIPIEYWLIPLTVIVCQVLALGELDDLKWGIAGVFNLIFLAVVVAWMVFGCLNGSLRSVILGSLLFVALVVARYFDLFESLVARGIVFLVVGLLLIWEGFVFRRQRSQLEGRTL